MPIYLTHRLVVDGKCVASFANPTDAEGFRRARYPHGMLLQGTQLSWILQVLASGPATIEAIADATGVPKKSVAAYLFLLAKEGKVIAPTKVQPATTQKGRWPFLYQLKEPTQS